MAKSVEECNREIGYYAAELKKATEQLDWWQKELKAALNEQQSKPQAD